MVMAVTTALSSVVGSLTMSAMDGLKLPGNGGAGLASAAPTLLSAQRLAIYSSLGSGSSDNDEQSDDRDTSIAFVSGSFGLAPRLFEALDEQAAGENATSSSETNASVPASRRLQKSGGGSKGGGGGGGGGKSRLRKRAEQAVSAIIDKLLTLLIVLSGVHLVQVIFTVYWNACANRRFYRHAQGVAQRNSRELLGVVPGKDDAVPGRSDAVPGAR